MSDERSTERVRRVLALLAEHLERHLDGDALALDGLGAALQDPTLEPDDLLAATWVLRSLERMPWRGDAASAEAVPDQDPGYPGGTFHGDLEVAH